MLWYGYLWGGGIRWHWNYLSPEKGSLRVSGGKPALISITWKSTGLVILILNVSAVKQLQWTHTAQEDTQNARPQISGPSSRGWSRWDIVEALYVLGADSLQRYHFTSIWNPIVEIRRLISQWISYTGKTTSLYWIGPLAVLSGFYRLSHCGLVSIDLGRYWRR